MEKSFESSLVDSSSSRIDIVRRRILGLAPSPNTCSPLDALADTAPSIEDVLCDKAELDQLLARLDELMPEARKIGRLRLKGLTDEAIAEVIGIKRTTFRSRIEKAKKQLAPEYPDRF